MLYPLIFDSVTFGDYLNTYYLSSTSEAAEPSGTRLKDGNLRR